MADKKSTTERRKKRSSDPKEACQYQLEATKNDYKVSGLSLSDAFGRLLAACCDRNPKGAGSFAVEQVKSGDVTMFLVGLGPEQATRAALDHAAQGVKRILKTKA